MRIPRKVQTLIRQIREHDTMGVGVRAMMERKQSFSSPMAATIAGIAVVPQARDHFDAALDVMFEKGTATQAGPGSGLRNEIVVGGGLHAAIYCAVRVAQGHPRPLVIEAERVGGSFAVSNRPTFYLNSRNRPGELSVPGMDGALNVIPEGVVQPADLSGDEYQRNSDLALAIRSTLAMSADVIIGPVSEIGRDVLLAGEWTYYVQLEDGRRYRADRVICASGLGNARPLVGGAYTLTFPEFMQRMDQPFPLRDMSRVAVIGCGDSGRTVIEALTGQGPSTGWSVASVDYLDKIDWYGVPADQLTRETYEACNRSRYRGIGRLLPRQGNPSAPYRVRPMTQRVVSIAGGYKCAYVNEAPYDLVVNCTGFDRSGPTLYLDYSFEQYAINGRFVGGKTVSDEVYQVGPASELAVSDLERQASPAVGAVPENSTALFRYAGRTASLAASFTGARL